MLAVWRRIQDCSHLPLVRCGRSFCENDDSDRLNVVELCASYNFNDSSCFSKKSRLFCPVAPREACESLAFPTYFRNECKAYSHKASNQHTRPYAIRLASFLSYEPTQGKKVTAIFLAITKSNTFRDFSREAMNSQRSLSSLGSRRML